jgi:hypothetical protein
MAPDYQPTYFAAVVSVDGGDARIMCMAQRTESGSLNVHYFKIDTSIEDESYDFAHERRRTFREELRGTGLAVNILSRPVGEIIGVIESDLHDAYGTGASVVIKQVASPSVASLFV